MSTIAQALEQTQSLLFGLAMVHDQLDKARRERGRLPAETDKAARTDLA